MFNFQHSQRTQKELDKLADLLLRYPTVYATSKFDVGKINSPLDLKLLDILEQYEIISPVKKKNSQK